ncbi:MAG: type IV toxin-antitoxin system AbiEi family antitoxin [Bacteroidales bacterium]|nr:type IV toxin-antitoxin system AbiEi family antitoxin [Bacteroidales bacterium]
MNQKFKKTSEFIKDLQKKGRYTFSLEECLENVPKQPVAVKRDLDRLKKNEEILSIWKGFYLIVTLEYATRGIMPAILFIDSLMKHLDKDYYVGLLSAAAQHGASHQQPQEFFVIIKKPPIRPLQKKGLRINFIVKNNWPLKGIETQKTSTGFVQVSSPELTALDLTIYVKRIGGFNRLAVILNELTDEMDVKRLLNVISGKQQITSLQRLGYILDRILEKHELSEAFYEYMKKQKAVYISLQAGKEFDQAKRDSKWKIIPNVEIDLSP